MGIAFLIFMGLVIFGVLSGVRKLDQWERGIVLRFGRALPELRGPGLILVIPFGVDQVIKVDTRTVTFQVPQQEVITRDNVSARVTAVVLFRVVEPAAAVLQIENYQFATSQVAQTALRAVLGQSSLDELLAERDQINDTLQEVIDKQTQPWGVKVGVVEVKDVELPEEMRRALAREAEAERERRAKVIAAEGEFQAAARLTEAADLMSTNPVTLQLRYLQTLVEIGAEQNTTTIFPIPIDLFEAFKDSLGGGSSGGGGQGSGQGAGPSLVPPPPQG